MRWCPKELICLALFAVQVRGQDEISEDLPVEDDTDPDLRDQDALSPEQMRRLHAQLDLDKNGRAAFAEVLEFNHHVRQVIARADIQTVMDEMDSDQSGSLTLQEVLKDFEHWGDDEETDKNEQELRIMLETKKFKVADDNGDGTLDLKELPSLFYPETHPGVLALASQATLNEKDTDKDGELTAQEFWEIQAAGMDSQEPMDISEEEMQDFKKLDKDGNGKLNLEELKPWESGYFHTEEAMKKLFEIADKDHDGHLSADEMEDAAEAIQGTDAQYHLLEWSEHAEL